MEALAAGMTWRQVADSFHTSTKTIAAIKAKKNTDQARPQAFRLFAQGAKLPDVAAQLRISQDTASRLSEEEFTKMTEREEKARAIASPTPAESEAKQSLTDQPPEGRFTFEYVAVPKMIDIDRRLIAYYKRAQAEGYTGSFGRFLSDCVIELFRQNGIEVGIIRE